MRLNLTAAAKAKILIVSQGKNRGLRRKTGGTGLCGEEKTGLDRNRVFKKEGR